MPIQWNWIKRNRWQTNSVKKHSVVLLAHLLLVSRPMNSVPVCSLAEAEWVLSFVGLKRNSPVEWHQGVWHARKALALLRGKPLEIDCTSVPTDEKHKKTDDNNDSIDSKQTINIKIETTEDSTPLHAKIDNFDWIVDECDDALSRNEKTIAAKTLGKKHF